MLQPAAVEPLRLLGGSAVAAFSSMRRILCIPKFRHSQAAQYPRLIR